MRITYEIVTPESAEDGDAAERGFVEPRFKLKVPTDEVMANGQDWSDDALQWSLRDAELFLGRGAMEDVGRWFSSTSPEQDFQSGAETYYSLHPGDGITPASYARLALIFTGKRA